MSSGRIRQTGDEDPDIVDIILDAIRSNQLEINTFMPGVVTSYEALLNTVSVQPSFKRTMIDPPELVRRPELTDVPVVFPRTATGGLSFPIEVGDPVGLIFSQRSMDDWLLTGLEGQVFDSRLHDINDAIAIPGLQSKLDLPLIPLQDGFVELRGEKVFIGDPTPVVGKFLKIVDGVATLDIQKVFLGDSLQFITPIITTGAGPGLPVGAPVSVPIGPLDIIDIMAALMDLVGGAFYGIGPPGPAGGGGGVDAETTAALAGLKADLLKLKV